MPTPRPRWARARLRARAEGQDELARRNRYTEALLETVDVGIVSCGPDGTDIQRNRAARAITGVESGRQSTELLEMFGADGRRLDVADWPLYRVLRGLPVLDEDHTLGPRGGPYRTVSVRGRQATHGDVTIGAVLAMTDVTQERAASQVLEQERERLEEAQRLSALGSYTYDMVADRYAFSAELLRIWGLPADHTFRRGDLRAIHPDDIDGVWAFWQASLVSSGTTTHDFRMRRTDGERRYLRATIRIQRAADGRPLVLHGTHLDVTDLTVARQDADRANAFLQAVIAASPDPTYVLEVASGTVLWGVDECALLGYPADHVTTRPLELTHPDDRALLLAAVVAATGLPDGEVSQIRTRALHADGTVRWLSRRFTPFRRAGDGSVADVLGVLRDETDTVEAEARLRYAALYDPLTGLANRHLLMETLGQLLAGGADLAVLYCDLDGFKRVNDTAGHAAGDAVLVAVADRLRGVLRDADLLARVGGDEFVVVVHPLDSDSDDGDGDGDGDGRAAAVRVAERMTEALRPPFLAGGLEHVVSASVGVSFGGPSAENVLQDADAAMYLAKRDGRDRVAVFEDSLRTDLVERGRVERVLRRALARAAGSDRAGGRGSHDGEDGGAGTGPQLYPAFQPVVTLAGGLVGFEALARLTDDDGVPIPPDVFIALAEDTGLIGPLGAVMLDAACGQLARWRRERPGLGAVTMSVNVSALQAQDVSLRDDVRATLIHHGLRGGDLVLELTETALLQASPATIAACEDLRADGVGISIDDFGVGYASLRYLASLPVSAVKVDRSFTAGLPLDATSAKIVRAIAGLAADLSLGCVVEGVETREQREALPAGVHVQGWLTGRPHPAADVDLDALLG